MSKTKIKIDHSEAKSKIDAAIEKGKKLAKQGLHILKDTLSHTDQRIRARDNFAVLYNQWRGFTAEILLQVYVSSTYANEFNKKESSKKQLVGSNWQPDVDYYLEKMLIPKIDYLNILSGSIDQFQKEKVSHTPKIYKKHHEPNLEMPDRVTLAWLWRKVPLRFWFWLVGLLVAAFLFGLSVGQLDLMQDLLNQINH